MFTICVISFPWPAIFSGTIASNIALSKPEASRQEILDAASFVGLEQFLLKAPDGLQTPVQAMGINLSGGQAACIALARMLIQSPDVLVLDEALIPIDPKLRKLIYIRLLERFGANTCIFVSNEQMLHQKADRIVVLYEGRLVEQGTYSELMQKQGHYQMLYQQAVGVG
jgi:ABC-type bacteriocin/lantibiotic exporter with double-glycine peptidase domain